MTGFGGNKEYKKPRNNKRQERVPSEKDHTDEALRAYQKGDILRAKHLLDRTIEIFPKSSVALGFLATIEKALGFKERALTLYIFQVNPYRVLRRGVKGYENTKLMTTQIRKRMGLKFDEVKFKKEKKTSAAPSYRGGRIETSRNYNPSKRGRFRGVSYADGSYADLD